MTLPRLTVRGIRARAAMVPMRRPLATRVGTFDVAPLLLIDLDTGEGVTGRTYLFTYHRTATVYIAGLLDEILALTRGDPVAPVELWQKVFKGLTLLGHQGLSMMALAGFDLCCWDALARAAEAPLVRLLGGTPRPIRAYNSNGLGLMAPNKAAAEAQELIAEGNFSAVKVRLGRPTLEQDLAAFRAVRKAVGDAVILPTDFNQGLTVMEAIRRGQALDEEDVYWIEEPIRFDDLDGNAKVSDEVSTPTQIGENFYGPKAMAEAIAAEAADYMMPDLEKIGGVTGWLRAAALADAAGIEMSSHLFPEVSCHLMAVTPTAHWLEYVDWAAPVLAEPLVIENGHALIPDRPGSGIDWDEAAVKRYQVPL